MQALVVEDEQDVRSFVKRSIEHKYIVSEAKEGEEALNLLKNNNAIKMILVDWNMPGMNGHNFVKAVRANKIYDNIPILMMTSEKGMDTVVQALNAGANEYLMKPFTTETLLKKISMLKVT